MNEEKRFYNKEIAHQIEDKMNKPYSYEEGPECHSCKQNDNDKYELTGYVIFDGVGLYAEKRCVCGTIIHDGDGDFTQKYIVIDNEILEIPGGFK